MIPAHHHNEYWLRATAHLLAILTALLGAAVLCAWALESEVVKRLTADSVAMKPNTAVGFILGGLAMWWVASPNPARAVRAVAASIALIVLAFATLTQDLFAFSIGVDEILFHDNFPFDPGHPGRMSPWTAAAFLIAGFSLLCLSRPDGILPILGQAFSLLGLTLASIFALGYVAGIPELYEVPPYTPPALPAAIGLLLLNTGVFCARPDLGITAFFSRSSSGSVVARRLIPLAVILPAALGAILVSVEHAMLINTAFALAMASMGSGLFLVGVIWWTATAVDKIQHEALRERSFLETTLAGIGDAVIVTDPQGKIIFMNGIAETLTGWTTAAARGQSLEEVFVILDEQQRTAAENPVAKALRGNRAATRSNHMVLVARDGREYPVDNSAAPILDRENNLQGGILVFRDITDRRQQEQALAFSETIYRATFENAPIGIAHLDLNGKWLRLNTAVCEITGYPAEELRELSFADITHPEYRQAAQEQARLLAEGKRESYSMEKRYIRKDGSLVWVNRTVSTLRDSDNQPLLYISIIEDITLRKQAEAQQDKRLAELNAEARMRDRFLATLGHELRNPLAALTSANNLIARGVGDLESAHRMQATHTQQLTKLVNDLLDVARVTSGKVVLNKEQVDLTEIVHSTVEAIQGYFAEKEQHLALQLPAALTVEADAARMEQILTNLLVNASKYSDAGTEVTLRLLHDEEEAVIEVRDQGIGLTSEQSEVIFDPFVQATPGVGGLGIGLALVRDLVELHGGSIKARSQGPNSGSTFVVRFPIGQTGNAHSPRQIEHKPQRLPRPLRILIVDDARDAADALGCLLESTGGEVACTYDGMSALEKAGEWHPDVALVDIGLPDIPGTEVSRRLRSEGFDDALILAVTGFGEPGSQQKILDAGFDDRLVKPVDFNVVFERVLHHCERHPQQLHRETSRGSD